MFDAHYLACIMFGVAIGVLIRSLFDGSPRLRLKVGLIEVSADTIEDVEKLLNLRPVEDFKKS